MNDFTFKQLMHRDSTYNGIIDISNPIKSLNIMTIHHSSLHNKRVNRMNIVSYEGIKYHAYTFKLQVYVVLVTDMICKVANIVGMAFISYAPCL